MSSSAPQKVWLITGCSTGLGRALCQTLLDTGHSVAATARRLDDLAAIPAPESDPARLLRLALDVTDADQVDAAVARCHAHFGRIDVLVNNAGYGYLGAIEESAESDAREMFEVNFWGLARVTRQVLPLMRERRSGTIVNLSSIGGLRGAPGVGFYNATKFAVEGYSEALSQELAPLGIHVLLVEPSGFRTDWAGRSIKTAEQRLPDYAGTAHKRQAQIQSASGSQPGDPIRAAKAIIAAVQSDDPPLHLLLGKAALAIGMQKIESLRKDFDAWRQVTLDADFPTAD
ncbi:MAG: oxidoreductase [Burkholderiaceae bacterium]